MAAARGVLAPMMRVRLVLLVVAAAASASALPAASGATASKPLAELSGASAGGYPLAGGGPSGENIRFIDRGTFWVAVLVRNRSARPVTIVGARTPEPLNSLVRQARAGFSRYKPCPAGPACPWPDTPTSTRPLRLPPHTEAAVKLNYQLVSCAHAAAATTASANSLVLSYRYENGSVAEETVPLMGARLHLQRPAGVECLPRPYSYIGLVGSFTTSPAHRPIPGSDGDMCTKTDTGGLTFRSREFMDRSGVTFRIEITLPRYRGLGSYHRGAQTLGPAEVMALGGFGLHAWTVFHDPNGTVTVTTARGPTIGGRITAVFSGHRRFFRAYGAWRCTTRR
jgi:hypothetical protein